MPTLHPIQIFSSWYPQLAVTLCCSYSDAAAPAMLAQHRHVRCGCSANNPTPLHSQTMSR